MKIKQGFVLREVAGCYLVVAVGDAVKNFSGIVNLNETGAFLWGLMTEETDKEKMLKAVLDEYEIDEQTAKNDIDEFVNKIKEANLVE